MEPPVSIVFTDQPKCHHQANIHFEVNDRIPCVFITNNDENVHEGVLKVFLIQTERAAYGRVSVHPNLFVENKSLKPLLEYKYKFGVNTPLASIKIKKCQKKDFQNNMKIIAGKSELLNQFQIDYEFEPKSVSYEEFRLCVFASYYLINEGEIWSSPIFSNSFGKYLTNAGVDIKEIFSEGETISINFKNAPKNKDEIFVRFKSDESIINAPRINPINPFSPIKVEVPKLNNTTPKNYSVELIRQTTDGREYASNSMEITVFTDLFANNNEQLQQHQSNENPNIVFNGIYQDIINLDGFSTGQVINDVLEDKENNFNSLENILNASHPNDYFDTVNDENADNVFNGINLDIFFSGQEITEYASSSEVITSRFTSNDETLNNTMQETSLIATNVVAEIGNSQDNSLNESHPNDYFNTVGIEQTTSREPEYSLRPKQAFCYKSGGVSIEIEVNGYTFLDKLHARFREKEGILIGEREVFWDEKSEKYYVDVPAYRNASTRLVDLEFFRKGEKNHVLAKFDFNYIDSNNNSINLKRINEYLDDDHFEPKKFKSFK